jgi:beta-glucosidase
MTLRVAVALFAVSCGGGTTAPHDAAPPDASLPPAVGRFPDGFHWGTAIAPYQVEGGLHATDWHRWETVCPSCSGDHADDGPDFWNRYAEDLGIAVALGTNAIRLGIEWARVFPTRESFPGSPDAAAVARYHAILDEARRRGLIVMVALHHFSTPLWLADPARPGELRGWEDAATADLFATWAGWVAAEFGADVDWWLTINEPLGYVAAGWLGGVFPPGKLGARDDAMSVIGNLIRGHARAYDRIHAADGVDADGDGRAAWVSFAAHNRVFLPRLATSAADVAAAEALRRVNNLLFLDAVTRGDLDWNVDGDLDDAGEARADPELAGRLDYAALQYYGVSLVVASGADLHPFALALMNDLPRYGLQVPVTDFGTVIYPQGLRVVLDELRPYGLPIVITENGLADAADAQRPRFLADHLYVLGRAIDDGLDVRGYYHWSLIDNFEWAAGYCPRFGLVHVDFADPARPRTIGEGARVYQEIVGAGTVPPSLFARYPAYPEPTLSCARTGL